jgi:hypothetical protein
MDDDEDTNSNDGQSSGNEWQGGEEEDENDFEGDDEEDMSGDESVINGKPPSLVVQLRYGKQGDDNNSGEQKVQTTSDSQKMAVAGPPAQFAEQAATTGLQQPVPVDNAPQDSIPETPVSLDTKTAPAETPASSAPLASNGGATQGVGGPAGTTMPSVQQPDGTV